MKISYEVNVYYNGTELDSDIKTKASKNRGVIGGSGYYIPERLRDMSFIFKDKESSISFYKSLNDIKDSLKDITMFLVKEYPTGTISRKRISLK